MKKKVKTILIISLLVILLGLVFYFGTKQSILPEETRVLDWDGIPVTVTTAFGTFINDQSNIFCDSNDKDVTIINDISTNQILVSSSTLQSTKRACVQGQPIFPNENRIIMEFELPEGEFTANCNSTQSVEVRNFGFEGSLSQCKVLINGINFVSGTETKTQTLTKNSNIKVIQITQTGDVSTSYDVSSKAILSFTPIVVSNQDSQGATDDLIIDTSINNNGSTIEETISNVKENAPIIILIALVLLIIILSIVIFRKKGRKK